MLCFVLQYRLITHCCILLKVLSHEYICFSFTHTLGAIMGVYQRVHAKKCPCISRSFVTFIIETPVINLRHCSFYKILTMIDLACVTTTTITFHLLITVACATV